MTPCPALRCACVCVCVCIQICVHVCVVCCVHRYTLTFAPFGVLACYDPLPGIKVCMCVCVCIQICVHVCVWIQIHPDIDPLLWPSYRHHGIRVCVCAYRYIYCIYLFDFYTRYDPLPGIMVCMCVCVCVQIHILNIFVSLLHSLSLIPGVKACLCVFVCVPIYIEQIWNLCVCVRERESERESSYMHCIEYICLYRYIHTHTRTLSRVQRIYAKNKRWMG